MAETSKGREGAPEYVAHVSEDGTRFESVETHLDNVSRMAAVFAHPFGADSWAYASGLLHDIGKYSPEFQKRILFNGPKVDHSTAGANATFKICPALAYCIAGHHGGLPDGGVTASLDSTLLGRLNRFVQGDMPRCDAWSTQIRMPQVLFPNLPHRAQEPEHAKFSIAFLIRMVFSCLVDADFLCTEQFMRGSEREGLRYQSIEELGEMLERKLETFYPPATPLNGLRCELLDECRDRARGGRGVYSLTAPTGAGKTYALMRFALQHAKAAGHKMRRVIVAEPYTSIIEQNAEVYRSVFGDENVLEHHANYDFDDDPTGDGVGNRLRLAAENWDAPIVITTNVQLFESLFSNKTSRCRRLHNIASSIIVLDEAQMIPTGYLIPCINALTELVKNYGCSVVLCSATQPALNDYFKDAGFPVCEIVSDVPSLFRSLRRVTYQVAGPLPDEELTHRLLGEESALCIVNSRKQALRLFEMLEGKNGEREGLYHLTTLMCPAHRKRILAEINSRMKREHKPCTVVATSLVEAGVDLDFPAVYRAIAGVDSMVQAAGRCNREGRRSAEESVVYLFEADNAYRVPADVRQRADVALSAAPELAGAGAMVDIGSPTVVKAYFNRLYFYKGEQALDAEGIWKALSTYSVNRGNGFPSIDFRSVAERVHLIQEGSHSIVIPHREITEEIERIQRGEVARGDMRRVAAYAVSVYDHDLCELLGAGAIEKLANDLFLLVDMSRYKESTGLDVEVTGGEGMFW